MIENITFEELSSEINAEFEESKPLDLDLDPTTAFAAQLLEKVKADNDETEANIAEMLEGIDPTANANTANAFKATASGEIVRVDDVSPIEHTAKAVVSGEGIDPVTVTVAKFNKNLLYYPYHETTKTYHGVTWTDNGDGSITINGTATGGAASFVLSYVHNLGETKQPANSNSALNATATNGVCTFSGGAMYNANLQAVVLNIPVGITVNNLTIYPQAEYGTVATDYEAPTGKATFTPNADGTVEIPSISPCMTLLTDTEGVNITLDYKQDSNAFKANVKADLQELDNVTAELATNMGDVEAALDSVLAIQESLIGGAS